MTFRVAHQTSGNPARCPYRVIVQGTGREIDWINQYLDYETLRRLTDNTLRSYAHELLHFLRWWESVYHTDAVSKDFLTESILLDYVRFQSGQERPLSGGTINQRVRPRLEERSGRKSREEFGLAFSPEFLREGSAVADFSRPEKVVLGCDDDASWLSVQRVLAASAFGRSRAPMGHSTAQVKPP